MNEPFENKFIQKKSNIKLSNSKEERAPTDAKQILDQRVENFLSKKEILKNQVQKLTTDFLLILDKKIIKTQMGPKESQEEEKIINELVNCANLIDEDPDFPEAFGSLMLNHINLKTSLKFRDRINNIELATRKIIDSLNVLNAEIVELKKNGK